MPDELQALETEDVASLLGVSERMVRNYCKSNKLPFRDDGRKRLFIWSEVREWYVAYRIDQAGSRGSSAPQIPTKETFDAAVLRKTVAEADLKELQLAREWQQVAAIEDVEKILTAANLSTRTQVEALPSRLSVQLIAIPDQGSIHKIVQRETSQLLSNLATISDVIEKIGMKPGPAEEE